MIVLLIAVDRIFKVTELARVDRDDYEGDAKTDAGCMWHGSQVGYKCGWLGRRPRRLYVGFRGAKGDFRAKGDFTERESYGNELFMVLVRHPTA